MKRKQYTICTLTFRNGRYLRFPAATDAAAKSIAKSISKTVEEMSGLTATDTQLERVGGEAGTLSWPLEIGSINAATVSHAVAGDASVEKMKADLTHALLYAAQMEHAARQDPDRHSDDLHEAQRVVAYLLGHLHTRGWEDIEHMAPWNRYLDVAHRAVARFSELLDKKYRDNAEATDYYATDRAIDDAEDRRRMRLLEMERADNAARRRIRNLNRENVDDAMRHLSMPENRREGIPW
jgi:hypothetical protein